MRPIDAEAFEKRIIQGFNDCKKELTEQGKYDFAEQLTKSIILDIREEPTLQGTKSNEICAYCAISNTDNYEICGRCGDKHELFTGKTIIEID